MIHLLHRPPKDIPYLVAASGGSDSMAALSFLHQYNRCFRAAYFHHRTPQADAMKLCVQDWCEANDHPFICGKLDKERPKDKSPEEFFRDERYAFLNFVSGGHKIITAHHLDDAIETYLFSTLHGNPRIIPSINGNIVRPFLLSTKAELREWCIKKNVRWVEDKSNEDVSSPRNRIRHRILPEAKLINPGLAKVVKKKYLAGVASVAKSKQMSERMFGPGHFSDGFCWRPLCPKNCTR